MKYCNEGYEIQQRTFHGLTCKAMLYLNLFYPTRQHHLEQVSRTDPTPSSEELDLAKACLDAVPKEFLNNESTLVYKGLYYLTLSEYHRFSDDDLQAVHNLRLTKNLAIKGNFPNLLKAVEVRLALLGSEDTLEDTLSSILPENFPFYFKCTPLCILCWCFLCVFPSCLLFVCLFVGFINWISNN